MMARCARTVHPHGRGEHGYTLTAEDKKRGSSPRAWGTRKILSVQIGRQRFIPTGVGNTSVGATDSPNQPVHPHGRGEHKNSGNETYEPPGSSPRAWGTPVNGSKFTLHERFIPTGVGNT